MLEPDDKGGNAQIGQNKTIGDKPLRSGQKVREGTMLPKTGIR